MQTVGRRRTVSRGGPETFGGVTTPPRNCVSSALARSPLSWLNLGALVCRDKQEGPCSSAPPVAQQLPDLSCLVCLLPHDASSPINSLPQECLPPRIFTACARSPARNMLLPYSQRRQRLFLQVRRRDESFPKSNSDIQSRFKANVSDATTGSCNFHLIFMAGFSVCLIAAVQRAVSDQWAVFKRSISLGLALFGIFFLV